MNKIDLDSLPEGHFGFPGPLRDKLVASILSGEKTGTSCLVYECEAFDEPLPAVGDREALLDSAGNRLVALETTKVEIIPFGEITLQHALDEAEGFKTVEDWQKAHRDFWESERRKEMLGDAYQPITDETEVVYTYIKVID